MTREPGAAAADSARQPGGMGFVKLAA